jgi:hypothetical protein
MSGQECALGRLCPLSLPGFRHARCGRLVGGGLWGQVKFTHQEEAELAAEWTAVYWLCSAAEWRACDERVGRVSVTRAIVQHLQTKEAEK